MGSSACCPHCVLAGPPRMPLPLASIHLSTSNAVPLEPEIRATRKRIHAGRSLAAPASQKLTLRSVVLRVYLTHFIGSSRVFWITLNSISLSYPPCEAFHMTSSEISPSTLRCVDENRGYYSTDISLCPWVLTHVCERWRTGSYLFRLCGRISASTARIFRRSAPSPPSSSALASSPSPGHRR
jgi:hypothetical protein